MTNTEHKIIKMMTMQILLENKKLLAEKPKFYHSKMFDADFDVKCDNIAIIPAIFSSDDDEARKYSRLIYECCPFFKEPELRNEFEIKEPYELVQKVFGDNIVEFFELGNFILEKYGFFEDKVKVKEIKKP